MTERLPLSAETVVAWDLPTRLFHWTLVSLVLAAWVSAEFASAIGDRLMVWHRWNGLAILVLLVWRLLWGVVGPRRARFVTFVKGPSRAIGYLRDLARGRSHRYLGHNPAGAIMVLALLGVLVAQASFGLFATDDNDLVGGPLYRLVEEGTNGWARGWHRRIFDYVLLPLVTVHIAANLLYQLIKKDPLVQAMISGRKPRDAYADGDGGSLEQVMGRAILCLAAAAVIVVGGILVAGGRL